MCEFVIYYRNGREKRYQISFSPWPSWGMLEALARAMLNDNGGYSCSFAGPSGLHGIIHN